MVTNGNINKEQLILGEEDLNEYKEDMLELCKPEEPAKTEEK